VFVDGKFAVGAPADVVIAAGLRTGAAVSPAELEALARQAQLREAWDYALNYLSYRARSREEVRRRLQRRDYDAALCEQVLQKLERCGLLDDREFARRYVRSQVEGRLRGRRALSHGLRRMGIRPEVVAEVLADELDPEAEVATALEAGKRRLRRLHGLDEKTTRRRLAQYLSRRGFEHMVVQDVLEALLPEVEE